MLFLKKATSACPEDLGLPEDEPWEIDGQVGDMISYVARNSDVIRHIVYQPASFSGRIDRTKLGGISITTPDVMRLFEQQTTGEIKKSDSFTLPMSQTLARMATKRGRHRDFCVHLPKQDRRTGSTGVRLPVPPDNASA